PRLPARLVPGAALQLRRRVRRDRLWPRRGRRAAALRCRSAPGAARGSADAAVPVAAGADRRPDPVLRARARRPRRGHGQADRSVEGAPRGARLHDLLVRSCPYGWSLPWRRSCSTSTAATVSRASSLTGVSSVLVVTGLSWFSGSSSRSLIVIF